MNAAILNYLAFVGAFLQVSGIALMVTSVVSYYTFETASPATLVWGSVMNFAGFLILLVTVG